MDLSLVIMFVTYVRPIYVDDHARIFVQLTEEGKVNAMLMTLERNMAQLTHDMPTLHMDRIPIDMQEHVVGVPPAWLRLTRKVSTYILCY